MGGKHYCSTHTRPHATHATRACRDDTRAHHAPPHGFRDGRERRTIRSCAWTIVHKSVARRREWRGNRNFALFRPMPPRQRAVKGGGNESAPWPERLSTAYTLFLAGKAQRSYYRVYVPSCTATCVLHGAPVVSLKKEPGLSQHAGLFCCLWNSLTPAGTAGRCARNGSSTVTYASSGASHSQCRARPKELWGGLWRGVNPPLPAVGLLTFLSSAARSGRTTTSATARRWRASTRVTGRTWWRTRTAPKSGCC
jgi:hypothetical protein